jgi:uncharacterized protein (TIGR00255 family)
MTGFARVTRTIPQGEVAFSLKSVNHRGLDLHFHMPPELDALENDIRAVVKKGVARGHIQVHLTLHHTSGSGQATWNQELLDAYLRAFYEAARQYQLEGKPDLNSALRLPGMITTDDAAEAGEDVTQAILQIAEQTVTALNEFRMREGEALAAEIRQRRRNISDLVDRMQEIRAGAVPAFHKRLCEKLSELLKGGGIDPQRLAQEAALLADRSDIAEELVRLRTHAAHLGEMLDAGGEIGKRLDFLLQEMNRESNTILSKTGGLGELGLTITDLALSAKSEIDKIREQSLNLE